MKVWRPLGKPARVETISSTADHLGNLVAEGVMHSSMFWPSLARLSALEAGRAHKRVVDDRRSHEDRAYRNTWVRRWLEDTGVA